MRDQYDASRGLPVRLLLSMVAVAFAVAYPQASEGASFSYGDEDWTTFERSGAWYMASASDTYRIRSGRVTVIFDEDMSSAAIESVVGEMEGLSVLRHTSFNTYDFEFSTEVDPGTYAAAFSRETGVLAAVPDASCIVLDATPNDDNYADQWAFHNTGQSGGTSDADIDAPDAWDSVTGDTTVVIAVIDIGFRLDHEDWEKSLWTNWDEALGYEDVDDDGNGFVDDVHGYDFFRDDGNPDADPWVTSSHGAHVGGIAAAKTNNSDVGVAGLAGGWGATRATGCKLMALCFGTESPDSLSFAVIDDAIEYAADNGADVIVMSLHTTAGIPGLTQAVNYAWSEGVLMVAASGNTCGSIYEPASNDKVMAISATDDDDDLQNYSGTGSQLNLSAPGGEPVLPGYPDTMNVLSTVGDDDYAYKSGTSMAAPMVAGAAALALSADSSLSNTELWSVLEFSVDDEAGTASEGWEDDYGWGRLNVGTMVKAIEYQENSYYTYSDSLCKTFCPEGDEDEFVITVTVLDGDSDPVQGVAARDIWLESYSPSDFKVCCVDEDVPRCYMTYTGRVFAESATDSNGETTITFDAGSGSYTNPMRKVRLFGLELPASGVPMLLSTFRSYDLDKDCDVDAADLAKFSTMRSKNNMAADFDCDNDVDTADSLLLYDHYGHECPGRSGTGLTGEELAAAELHQNRPNPFNPATRIAYQVREDGAHVMVAVYNIAGRLVRTLVDQRQAEGSHWVDWDGRDEAGRAVSSGVYFYRIEMPGFSEQRKMVLLK